ncbi:hypothetical protein TIA1EST1_06420 [Cutibacterium acnes hdn-1]|nr:hypothetical protein TIA1EST1_06420 [Cutibacterium acnes hdn-1]
MQIQGRFRICVHWARKWKLFNHWMQRADFLGRDLLEFAN